jgi:hypothetical protein
VNATKPIKVANIITLPEWNSAPFEATKSIDARIKTDIKILSKLLTIFITLILKLTCSFFIFKPIFNLLFSYALIS